MLNHFTGFDLFIHLMSYNVSLIFIIYPLLFCFLHNCFIPLLPSSVLPLSGLVIAMVVSMLFLLLLRFLAPVMVWVLIIGLLGAGAYGKHTLGKIFKANSVFLFEELV